MNLSKQYVKSIEQDLVESTTETPEYSIDDCLNYVHTHFKKHGLENYHMSKSKYNKMRAEYNDSKSNNQEQKENQGTVLIHKPIEDVKSKDVRILDELVMAQLSEVRVNVLREEEPVSNILKYDEKAYFHKSYGRIDKGCDMIIKLLTTKYKLLRVKT